MKAWATSSAQFFKKRENSWKAAAQGVYTSSTLRWKSRLSRNDDWHFTVPEGNSGIRGHTGAFINRDRHVMACHVSSNLMDILSSLT